MIGAALFGQAAEPVAGIQAFPFQGCEIVSIQDTPTRFPATLFLDVANNVWKQTDSFYEASVNVFLVRREGKTCLIDAGNDESRGSLAAKLRQNRISAEDITDIFITHIHPDHVGGLLCSGKALFPNAALHIAREELDAWKLDKQRSGLAKYLEAYKGKLHAFEYGEKLPCGLVPLKRGGHTPGHTIFQLALEDGMEIVFVGDIVHAAALQFPHPTFCARFDADPRKAVQSRIQTLQMHGILFGAHIPFPGVAQGGIILKEGPDWSFTYRTDIPLENKTPKLQGN